MYCSYLAQIKLNFKYFCRLEDCFNPQGDVANEKGYSHFPGNINNLVFKIPEYVENLTRTGGVIPEFVNPKYANAERPILNHQQDLNA